MKGLQLKIKSQRGLSLIELMIALLLGALLLFGVFKIFDTNQQTSRMANAFSRVQESGRISMEMIARDIRMADHWGCSSTPATITNHVDTTDANYIADLDPTAGNSVSGVDDTAATTIGSVVVKPLTDRVTLKGSTRLLTANPLLPVDEPNTLINITPSVTIAEGELLLMADCNAADFFANRSTSAGSVSYADSSATNGPVNLNNATVPISQEYGTHAQLYSPFSSTYFIGHPAGATYWSLYRQSDGGIPQELVRDVEDMQILYGEDTTGNGSVDRFVEADVAAPAIDMDSVISIRVTVTTNSSNTAKGDVMTRDYAVTANIRNRSL